MITSLVIVRYCCHHSGCTSALMYVFLNKIADICYSDSKKLVECRVAFTPKWRKRRAAAVAMELSIGFHFLSV